MMAPAGHAKARLAVLVSGGGTNLQSILDASLEGRLDMEVAIVISNRPKAYALERAQRSGVPSIVISHRRYANREDFEDALVACLREHDVDWVALAGFMRVLTDRFLGVFAGKVVNIHPALLPSFPGVEAQKQAFDYGVRIAGCTVHFVDEGTDSGPIIAQAAVPVHPEDDLDALRARILEQEHRIFPSVLQMLVEGRVELRGRKVVISGGRAEGAVPLVNPAPPR